MAADLVEPQLSGPRFKTLREGTPEEAGFSPGQLEWARHLLEEGIKEGIFPGAVALVSRRGIVAGWWVAGHARLEPEPRLMTRETLFDVASLTKVVATTSAFLVLWQRGRLSLDERVADFFPRFARGGYSPAGKDRVTLRHLLTHTSGLPGWRPLYLDHHGSEEMVEAIVDTDLIFPPGTKVEYSDLGFILLGEIIQQVTGEPLPVFLEREIFGPLGMRSTGYLPALWPPEKKAGLVVAATEHGNQVEKGMAGAQATRFQGWREYILEGEVNDGNAFYGLDGLAGHAGLFSTAFDLAILGQTYLNGGGYGDKRVFSPLALREARRNQTAALGQNRALGWHVVTPLTRALFESYPSSGGELVSEEAIGHTGFTGTSIWIDPRWELVVVLLTNRLHPTAREGIVRFRARFHNAVLGALEE